MRRTQESTAPLSERLTVTTPQLCEILSCGYTAATRIGESAHARVQVGRRVLWSTAAVRKYLDEIGA